MEKEVLKLLEGENFSDVINDEFYFDIDKIDEPKLEVMGKGIYKNNEYKVGGYRYYLQINLDDGDKTLTTIMQNPADTFPDKVWSNKNWINKNMINANGKRRPISKGFDKTVRNVIRIAKASCFSKIVVLNTFSLIQANGENAHSEHNANDETEGINKNFVCDYLKNHTKDLLIAWGVDIKINKDDYTASIIENKDINLWAYDWNKNKKCPYHPSQQVDNRLKIVRKFIRKPDLIPLEIKGNKLCRKQS